MMESWNRGVRGILSIAIGLWMAGFIPPGNSTAQTFSVDRNRLLLSEQADDLQKQGRTTRAENQMEAPDKDGFDQGSLNEEPVVENKPEPVLDRRWIIKMKNEKEKKSPAKQPIPIRWSSEEQKARCESYMVGIHDAFEKARYFSIGGDSCSTGRFSKSFLDQVKRCDEDCPEGYLKARGYTVEIIRNVDVLYELGLKLCMRNAGGEKSEVRSQKSAGGEQGEQKERRKEGERERGEDAATRQRGDAANGRGR